MDAITAVLDGAVPDLRSPGVAPLDALAGCPQTAVFHGEGDVAAHTALALERAVELAVDLPGDVAGGPLLSGQVLRLATLLHDVGKPATTVDAGDGHFPARGHEDAGAAVVSELFGEHAALLAMPAGVYPAVHAAVRDHMWTFGIDRVSAGAMLRMTHLLDPRLLAALWVADTTGRICADAGALADQVAYAQLVLADAGADRPDSFGLLEQVTTDWNSVPPRVRRAAFRELVSGGLRDAGAAAAFLAAAGRRPVRGSVTFTIGLPGLGKSTWARTVWAPTTDGVVLSAAGARKRDRRAAAAEVVQALPKLLGAGAHVCVDATHVSRQSRDRLLAVAGRYTPDSRWARPEGRPAERPWLEEA